MFDDFDLGIQCEEFYEEEESWDDFDEWDLECGFDPFAGCYDWDC